VLYVQNYPAVTRARAYARGRTLGRVDDMIACFRCGSTDHLKRDCPSARRYPPAPPPSSAPDLPPPVPPRRRPEEIADPAPWAAKIRATLTPAPPGSRAARTEDELRALAREQVAESRLGRVV